MTIKEIREEICDHYCKYPELIEDGKILYSICDKCPLVDLEVDDERYLEQSN